MLSDIIIGEPDATIAFAGKRVIEEVMKIEVPEGVQEAEYLLEKGSLDSIVPRNLFKGFLSELFAFHGISHFSEKKEEIYEKRITMFLSIRFMESFWFEPRSTQHRSLKGSSTTHQSTKAMIF